MWTRRQALGAGCSAAALLALPGCARHSSSVMPVGVVLTNGLSGFVVQELARRMGYLRELSLQRKLLVVSDGAKCVAALVSGDAEICFGSGFNQVPPAIANGAALSIVAGALNLCPLAMFSAKPDIRSVADLAGKVIGIGPLGAVVHQTTVILLKKKGVDVASVRFRNVGSAVDIFKAVVAGTVDAGLADVDVYDQQQQFGVHALPDGLLWKEIPEYTNQATYASEEALTHDRESLVRLLAAMGKVYRFISSPGSRADYLKAWQTVSGRADTTQALTQWNWIQQNHPYDTDLVLSDERIDFVQRMNVEFGAQKRVLPVAQIADMSLARDALKLVD
jgi:NitT/TauT family transport system substrate-binding protein